MQLISLIVKSLSSDSARRYAEDRGWEVLTVNEVSHNDQNVLAYGTVRMAQDWFAKDLGKSAPFNYGSLLYFNLDPYAVLKA